MHRRVLIVLTLVLPSVLAGQSPPTPELPNAVMLQFIRFADIFGSRLVAAFDSIPAARYHYRPTPSQQTIGYIAQHLEDANYSLCERLGVLKHPRTPKDSLSDTVKAQWPKDTLVKRLEAALRFCDTAMQRVGKLESSALARYVGVYELEPGLELDVTLQNGALHIRSSIGGAAVQLWPESNNDFFAKDVDAQVTFVRDASGAVSGLVLHQYGRDRPARKRRS